MSSADGGAIEMFEAGLIGHSSALRGAGGGYSISDSDDISPSMTLRGPMVICLKVSHPSLLHVWHVELENLRNEAS